MADWFMSVDDFIHEHLEVNDYRNYCEALINESGKIGYAIPSHQYALMRLYGDYSRYEIMDSSINKKIYDKIPIEAGVVQWICEDLNVASVWYHMIILPINYTEEQLKTIATLMNKNIIRIDSNIDVSVEKSLLEIREDPNNENFKNQLDTLHEYKRNRLDAACLKLYTLLKEE